MKYPNPRFLVTRWDAAGLLIVGWFLGLLTCGVVRFLWPGFFCD